MLANVHSVPVPPATADLSVPPPAGFFLHRPGQQLLHGVSAAGADLVRLVQHSYPTCERLEALRSQWRQEALIHYDTRWDNVLITRSRGGAPALKLVDWEAAGLGDPAWDLGSFLGEYVAFWINSIPIAGDAASQTYVQLAKYPIARMQPALRACWDAYVRTASLTELEAEALLLRATSYAGVKLMETALEHVQQAPEYTMTAVCLLQTGANLVADPNRACEVLLGIRRR
jgi:aminoglycoside phosphotransferase (APT) family kinase protein